MRPTRSDHEADPLPFTPLRFGVPEAAHILRMSRAQIYIRIGEGLLKPQKDGHRTYFTQAELVRYVESCGRRSEQETTTPPPSGPTPAPTSRKSRK
jgi:Helix-turn-helix domain